jgi:hypothetical protein
LEILDKELVTLTSATCTMKLDFEPLPITHIAFSKLLHFPIKYFKVFLPYTVLTLRLLDAWLNLSSKALRTGLFSCIREDIGLLKIREVNRSFNADIQRIQIIILMVYVIELLLFFKELLYHSVLFIYSILVFMHIMES